MFRIVHLIPYDGLGGVEAAAKTISYFKAQHFEFCVEYIFLGIKGAKETLRTYNLFDIISKALRYSNGDADVLIVSLWRSCIVGCIVKLFRRRVKLVVFLHCSEDKHFADRIFTRAAAVLADEIWADSKTTLVTRIPFLRKKRSRVISFVARKFEAPAQQGAEPSFIFWGRLTPQKGIERAIRIFEKIHYKIPSAQFRIIGPDAGSLPALKLLCASLNLNEAVSFTGVRTHDEIADIARNASFYLQTSEYEGMAMSVVEAMQLGLVPVVTPVGEIGLYCRNGSNSVIVQTDQQAAEAVIQLLHSNARFQALRSAAIATWKDQPLYRDTLLKACQEIFDEA